MVAGGYWWLLVVISGYFSIHTLTQPAAVLAKPLNKHGKLVVVLFPPE